jgi:tetratricopeptide (TPR) repeat protein
VGFIAAAGVRAQVAAPASDAATGGVFRWSWVDEESPSAATSAPAVPPEPAAITVGSYGRLIRENLDLRNQLNDAMETCGELKRENSRLFLQIDQLEAKRRALAASLTELRPGDELQTENAKLRLEKAVLEEELLKLKQDMLAKRAGGEAPAPLTPPPGALVPTPGSDLYRKLEAENADLRKQVEQVREIGRRLSSTRQEMARKEQTLGEDVDRLKQEKAALETQVAQLKTAREKDRKVMRLVAKRALAYKGELDGLQKEAAEVQEALSQREEEVALLTEALKKEIVAPVPPAGEGEPVKPVPPEIRPGGGAVEAGVGMPPPKMSRRDRLFQSALTFTDQGKYAAAEAAYRALLRLDPSDADAHYNLGLLYDEQLRDPEKALTHLRRYLELNPDAEDADAVGAWLVEKELGALREMATVEFEIGEAGAERPAVCPREWLKEDPLFEEGLAYEQQAKYRAAEASYLAALRRNPNDANAHYNLALLYEQQLDNPRQAAAHYRSYLDLRPDADDADVVRAWLTEMDLKSALR